MRLEGQNETKPTILNKRKFSDLFEDPNKTGEVSDNENESHFEVILTLSYQIFFQLFSSNGALHFAFFFKKFYLNLKNNFRNMFRKKSWSKTKISAKNVNFRNSKKRKKKLSFESPTLAFLKIH